jgi:hypothetical protein
MLGGAVHWRQGQLRTHHGLHKAAGRHSYTPDTGSSISVYVPCRSQHSLQQLTATSSKKGHQMLSSWP